MGKLEPLSMSVTWKVKFPRAGGVPQNVTGAPQAPWPLRSKVSQVGNVGAVVFADQL